MKLKILILTLSLLSANLAFATQVTLNDIPTFACRVTFIFIDGDQVARNPGDHYIKAKDLKQAYSLFAYEGRFHVQPDGTIMSTEHAFMHGAEQSGRYKNLITCNEVK